MKKAHSIHHHSIGFFVLAICFCLFLFGSGSCKKKNENSENAYEQDGAQIRQTETQVNEQEKLSEEKQKEKMKEISKADKAEALKKFFRDPDNDIRAAAAARAGEIGGEDAVKILGEAFDKEARVIGTDVPAGIKGEILMALAQTGEAEAKRAISRIIDTWLQEGPSEKGDYAHLYDSQYYVVLEMAIKSLASFPDDETKKVLTGLAADPALFYSLREAAWWSFRMIEMKEKGIESPRDRVSFLLAQIEPEGVLIEKWWTGKKPGEKTLAASREAMLEELVTEIGWDAVEELKQSMQKTSPDQYLLSLASARMHSRILVQSHSDEKPKILDTEQKEAILEIIRALEKLPDDLLSSETAAQIFDQLQALADILKDRQVWESMKKIGEKIHVPGAWKDSTPGEKELGLAIPEDSVFVARFSRKIKLPKGTVVSAYYFSDEPAEEIVSHFEEITGKTARKEIHTLPEGLAETRYVIALEPIVQDVADFFETGITVYGSSQGYEEKAFGQIQRTGKSMFRIISTLPNR